MYKYIKRFLDFFLTLLSMIVIFPVLIVLAIIVEIQMGHPFYFTQIRTTKGKREFKLMKFRSMTNETDENGKLEIKGISDKLRVHVHNHTNGFSNPSTSDNHLGDGNDLDFSESIISSSPNCSFFIYTKDNGGVYSKYNVNGDCGPNIPSRFDKPQYGLQLDKTSGWIRPSPLFDNRYH